MEFSVKSGSPEKQRSACVVVGVIEPRRLSPVAEQLDKISDGYISSLLRRGDLEGKPGQMLLLHQVPGVLSERVLLVGCGKERELDERQYKQIINKTITTLNETGSMEAVCFLTELHVKGRDTIGRCARRWETTKAGLYSFDQFKTNKAEPRRPLRKLARRLADAFDNITTKVIGEQEMAELSMNSYLAVARGSDNEAMMAIIEYKGHPDAKPIVLVGKGLTFDSGGISIKPAEGMDEMKYDMGGAASVLGTHARLGPAATAHQRHRRTGGL
ncbi:UNVERIFIED_CONTAM: hypothetical protein K2H54_000002 [Gekko kuhli]